MYFCPHTCLLRMAVLHMSVVMLVVYFVQILFLSLHTMYFSMPFHNLFRVSVQHDLCIIVILSITAVENEIKNFPTFKRHPGQCA